MPSVPYAVSLVAERCQAPNNVLKVIDNDVQRAPDVDFAVCVTPLNLRFDDVHRLIEFIEVLINSQPFELFLLPVWWWFGIVCR